MIEIGFGGVVSQIIIVFTLLSIITLVIFTYRTYVQKTNLSMEIQKQSVRNQLETNFEILNTSYDPLEGDVHIYVKNTGKTKINMSDLDLFINNTRMARGPAVRNITILSSTNLVNPQMWDPVEEILINVSKTLSSGNNYLIEVIGTYGIKQADIIGVE